MRTIQTTLYKFNELSEQAKRKAIESMSDINVDFDWWESTYDDARRIGLKIEGFDVDRYVQGHFIESAEACADLILNEHGETCETYKTAKQYLTDRDALVEKYSDGINKDKVTEENEYDFDSECDELDSDFLKSLLEDYRIILRNEIEYRQSEEAIQETIEANEYEFLEDGTRA